MNPLLAPYTPTEQQLAAQRAAAANNTSDPSSISSVGTAFNLPSIWDTNNQQARQDAFSGATDIFGNTLRGTDSSAYGAMISTPAYTVDGIQYNAAGDVLNGSSTQTSNGTGMTQSQYDQLVQDQINQQTANQAAQQTAQQTASERAAYQDQISNLDRLLGNAQGQYNQGISSINSQYDQNQTQQDKAFADQRLNNTQAQEKGYNQVGNFANTSYNNLNRLLQGSNAGRSSVGQVLMPFMVGQAADTRRNAVTNTAGENSRNIDTLQTTSNQDISNGRKNKLQGYEQTLMNTQNDLESQKRTAQLGLSMADGQNYEQAMAGATGLTNNINNRQNALTALFDKYKPDYTVKEAPALGTYQVDPAQINQGQNNGVDNSFYQNQLKRKKELGL